MIGQIVNLTVNRGKQVNVSGIFVANPSLGFCSPLHLFCSNSPAFLPSTKQLNACIDTLDACCYQANRLGAQYGQGLMSLGRAQ